MYVQHPKYAIYEQLSAECRAFLTHLLHPGVWPGSRMHVIQAYHTCVKQRHSSFDPPCRNMQAGMEMVRSRLCARRV